MRTFDPTPDPRASIARELAAYYSELAGSDTKPAPKFSLARVLDQMLTERGLVDGYEREVTGSAALMAGRASYDPHRITLPLSVLGQRDMQAAGDAGYLVGVENFDPLDVLRGWSTVVSAGIQRLVGLTDNVMLPRTTTASTAHWLAGETAQIADAQPVLGSVAMTPCSAAAIVSFSHTLRRQSPNVEAYLRRQIVGAVGTLLDTAFFAGSGSNGEPRGLVNAPSIGSQSGTSLAHAGILAMRKAVLDAGGREDAVRWVSTPTVQALLGARERSTGGGRFLWDDDGILGRPAAATVTAPASSLIAGDFSTAVLAWWGPGSVQFEIDPYSSFKSGVVSARVIVTVDFAFPLPGGFCLASSIT